MFYTNLFFFSHSVINIPDYTYISIHCWFHRVLKFHFFFLSEPKRIKKNNIKISASLFCNLIFPQSIFEKITCDIVAFLHEFHFANGFILLDFVGFVRGFAVSFVVGVADIWALGFIATCSHQWIMTYSDGFVERLKSSNII